MSQDMAVRAREVRAWYEGHVYKCRTFQERMERHLARALRTAELDNAKLESRTKSVASYVAKATKVLPSGEPKYADPRREITDAVGLRVLVPLSTDLPPVSKLLKDIYIIDEEIDRGDEEGHVDVPGYRSLHYLVRLTDQDQMDVDFREFGDMVAEVQVRTTLQHAWASLQHDLMYKSERAPAPTVRRRLISLAGLLELADREFVSVRQVHAAVREESRDDGASVAGRITATSLRHLAETLLAEEDPSFQDWFIELNHVVAQLGFERIEDVLAALGPWRGRATDVAAAVRVQRPWANSAYVFDLLLRLALGERYLAARPIRGDDDKPVTGPALDELTTRHFDELAQVEAVVSIR